MILITGAFGQLGELLQKEFLKNDKLILVDRNIHKKPKLNSRLSTVIEGDLLDPDFCNHIFKNHSIDKIFNFATQSFVERADKINLSPRCIIFDNIISSIEKNKKGKKTWLLHPLSSEIFGVPSEVPQTEKTERSPINSYGLQKSFEELKCHYLRNKGYQIYNPILYNAESKYRDEKFFTKKIISHLKQVKFKGFSECLEFYNANSSRDFGYAEDYIKCFLDAANSKKNIVELLGSGKNVRIIDFIEESLNALKMPYETVLNEKGHFRIYYKDSLILKENGRDTIDEKRVFAAKRKYIDDYSVRIRGGKELIKLLVNE